MSTLTCDNCGGVTNTAVSDWAIGDDGHVSRAKTCYAKFEQGR
jgi:hypothetical protein